MPKFTAEEFAEAEREMGNYLRVTFADSKHRRQAGIVTAAVRIAALVMTPGVIEDALQIIPWQARDDVAAAIRKALTENGDV